MNGDLDLRDLARRATARVLARSKAMGSDSAPLVGVHVDARRVRDVASVKRASGARLVSVNCLSGTPAGGKFVLPTGATVTPLAREEAFVRRIQFVSDGWHPTARRVAVGADHGGFELKGHVIAELQALGIEACDVGTHSTAACDYPDFALAVARAVSEGRVDLGVMIDGVGIGSAMAANRVPGVLAANCWDERTARSAREHNYANVLTLGAAHLDARTLPPVLLAFLNTPVGPDRHARRVAKITALDVRPREQRR